MQLTFATISVFLPMTYPTRPHAGRSSPQTFASPLAASQSRSRTRRGNGRRQKSWASPVGAVARTRTPRSAVVAHRTIAASPRRAWWHARVMTWTTAVDRERTSWCLDEQIKGLIFKGSANQCLITGMKLMNVIIYIKNRCNKRLHQAFKIILNINIVQTPHF